MTEIDMNHVSMVEVLVGLPASGKSTYAKTLVEQGWMRVNKDCLREMMFFSEYSKENEEQVDAIEMHLMLYYLHLGKKVVVDDTNLNPKRIKLISDTLDNSPFSPAVMINNKFCFVPIEECIKRDAKREKSVGKEVITNMWDRYLKDMDNVGIFDRENS